MPLKRKLFLSYRKRTQLFLNSIKKLAIYSIKTKSIYYIKNKNI